MLSSETVFFIVTVLITNFLTYLDIAHVRVRLGRLEKDLGV